MIDIACKRILKMASVFESYEQQLANLTAEITTNTSKIPDSSGAEKKSLVKQIERNIDEAKELLEQMDLEVNQLHSSVKNKYQMRLKSYETEMSRLEKDLEKARMTYRDDAEARNDLFALGGGGGDEISVDQRTRLLDNNERLERSSRKLQAGYRLAIETEQIGAEVLNDLHSQRETIQRARIRIRETDEDLGKSSRILTAMMRRILQNRAILYAVVGVMVIVIILTIYLSSSS